MPCSLPAPPPVKPISVSRASPGPLTTQPITDSVMGVVICARRFSSVSTVSITLKPWRAQDGQEVIGRAYRPAPRRGTAALGLVAPCPILHEMRLRKAPEEIERLREAARISAEAHELARQVTRPGLSERQVQAVIEQHFLEQGARGPAYGSIVAGVAQLAGARGLRVVAEGIETALAVHLGTGMPVWSALFASLLARLEPPLRPAGLALAAAVEQQLAELDGPALPSGDGWQDLTRLAWCSIDNDDSRDARGFGADWNRRLEAGHGAAGLRGRGGGGHRQRTSLPGDRPPAGL